MNLCNSVLLPALLLVSSAFAQWEIPTPLVLEGDSVERRVTGLADPMAMTDGVSVATVREQVSTQGTASGTDQLLLSLVPAPAALTPGLSFSFVPTLENTGPVTVDLNGLGAVPVLRNVSEPLDSAELRPGLPVHVVYDGQAFQVVNMLCPSCPIGYFPISKDVCAEILPHAELNFYASATYCTSRNARLCSFGEWVHGCRMANGFLPTVMDFEWVDHAANDVNKAKRMGFNDVSPDPDCTYGSHRIPTGLATFRCCYER